MAGKGNLTLPTTTSSTPSTTSTPSGVWAATTASTAVPDSGTDIFGLPSNMKDERIYVGYIPPTPPRKGTRIVGGEKLPAINSGSTDVNNSTVTAHDLIQHFHDLANSTNPYTRKQWADVQMQLQAMNAYGTDTRINYGGWNGQDVTALDNALKGYLGGSDTDMTTFEEYLAKQAAQGAANQLDMNQPGAPGTGTQRAPLSLTNSADLNAAGDTAGQQLLGHSLDPSQQGQFTDSFHSQEQAAYDAAGAGDGAAYQAQPTAANAARQFVVDHNLPAYASHQAEGFMNAFANMFLHANSARANTTLGDVAVGGK